MRGDVDANIDEHLELAERAESAGARVLVFPELSLTGYEIELAFDLAFTLDDARLRPLLGAAAAFELTLVVGAPLRIESHLYIAALALGPSGQVAVYTKQRLGAFGESARVDGDVPPAKNTVFHAGNSDTLVGFDGHSAALAVCADIGDPAHAERARARGAGTYLASMFVIPSEFEGDSARLASYATQHAMVVAMANYGGPSGGLRAAGQSSIWSPSGELLVRLEASGPGVAVATHGWDGWSGRSV